MGAAVPYIVTVLRLVEDRIEVSAVTADEAIAIAEREPGVARVVSAQDAWGVDHSCD